MPGGNRSANLTQHGWYLEMIKQSLLKRFERIRSNNESGWFLVSTIIIVLFLTAIGLTVLALSSSEFQFSRQQLYIQGAELTAEAGIEQSVAQLNQNSGFGGYTTPTVFFNNATQGYGVFTATISSMPSNANGKLITSTGYVYNYNDHSQLLAEHGVEVTVIGTSTPGVSVISGPGGLILSGSAAITNSTLDINGYIDMSGRSTIGTPSVPSTVNVADYWCPQGSDPGSTYPSLCPSTIQPISLEADTYIYGTVCATNQTSTGPNGNEIQGGSTGKGLEVGCTASPVSMTTYNWQAQESAVTTTASGTSGQYACSGSGSVTFPANIELTGNVVWGNSCNYDITGNIYIDGNLTIDGATQIKVDNSLGTTMPVILVKGTINVGGSGSIIENSDNTGAEFISIDSNDSACNTSTSSCSTITGTALYNTQTFNTVTVGGAFQVQGSIFDAYWGEITLDGSGIIGGAEGQTINMSGSGTITFGTELNSGSTTWNITSYEPYNVPG